MAGNDARGLLRTLRVRFRLIYLAPVLAFVALFAWALASPMGAAPDDDYHLASIWCGNPLNTDACAIGDEEGTRELPAVIHGAACFAQQPELGAVCQDERFDFDQQVTVETNRGNFAGQYPPVFYGVMSLFVGPNILASILVMRLFTIVLFVGITTALAFLLPASRRVPLIAGWLITTVPLGAFLLASNNPSSWAIIGVGSAWIALVGYFESTGRRRIALGALFAATALMAAGSRSDAAIFTVIGIGLAIWLTFRRDRSYLLWAILPVVMAIVAALFYLTSAQSAVGTEGLGGGTLQPDTPIAGNAPRDAFGLLAYNLLYVPVLWAGAFGQWGLGWLDTTMPSVVWVGACAVFAAVAFAGLVQVTWRKALAVLGVGILLWVIPTYVLVAGGNVVGENVQPRYLLPLIVVLGMVALLPVRDRLLQLSWLQLSIAGTVLFVAFSFALHSNIRRYVTGVDAAAANLDAGAEWWWGGMPSPMTTWVIGVLAYAGLLAVLIREVTRRGTFREQLAV
jgi:hypothetical protein